MVIIPKYRKKRLYSKFSNAVGCLVTELCRQKRVELVEGYFMPDHIHMCLSVPPKFSLVFIIGFLKGKSAIPIHREILEMKRVTGLHFWSRGYDVSTIGLAQETVRKYIRDQEKLEKRQLNLDLG